MDISFPQKEAWDGSRDVMSFPAEVDGKQVRCAISWEALQDNFGGNGVPPLECFKANRGRIQAKAERLIRAGRFESDGSIVIRSQEGR